MAGNWVRHWFHYLPDAGQPPAKVVDWERKAHRLDELLLETKKLKKELSRIDNDLYGRFVKDKENGWSRDEIYNAVQYWKPPDWWEPF